MDGVPNEIVIVRRKNSWDEDYQPHGVWKIAYADFMTALMAFFLVMWLINVTDDSVRQGVAQYFNPVKLASTAPNRKGLNDPQVDGDTNDSGTKPFQGKLGGSEEPFDQDANFGVGIESGHKMIETEELPEQGGLRSSGQFTQTHAESILFSDPYAILDTLAEQIRVAETLEDNPQGIGTGLQKEDGAQGGQAYRDPFDPLFWQFRPGRGVDGADVAAAVTTPGEDGSRRDGARQGNSAERSDSAGDLAYSAGADEEVPSDVADGNLTSVSPAAALPHEGAGEGSLAGTDDGFDALVAHVTGRTARYDDGSAPEEGMPAAMAGEPELQGQFTEEETETVAARLSEILEDADGTVLEETASLVSVSRVDGATLISLTDDQAFGMFAIGSAEPRPELVSLLERIGKVIAETPGQIVIKGHTDARPFRSKTYDNWRLSSARAHMALYMLSRGGVAKDRFDRVEGLADRQPKIPADPLAAANRRIEIYLLEGED
ncbi:MAG: MotB family protein [Roseibium sp.]